jgi:hypothetical protein
LYLDAFIYPEGRINEPDSFLIRIKDGIVLSQKGSMGDDLLAHVNGIFKNGPEKTPAWEIQEIMSWLPKMLERAKRNDSEGNYRRHWLQTELLKCYFRLRDMWYLGSKKSFAWLEAKDRDTFEKFDTALQPNASTRSIEALIKEVLKIGKK